MLPERHASGDRDLPRSGQPEPVGEIRQGRGCRDPEGRPGLGGVEPMSLILDDSQLELLAYLVSAEAERLDHEAHMKETGRSRPTRWEKAHAEGLRGRAV